MRKAFSAFAIWLGGSSGDQRAALSLSRYTAFFQAMESHWQRIPTYPEMLNFFGVDTLRRYRKVVEWLSVSEHIVFDARLRDYVAEEQRIQRMLQRIPSGTPAWLLVNEYMAALRQRNNEEKLKLKTVRLSLTPAIGLLQMTVDWDDGLPEQKSVDHYIATHHGQRASLTGFLTFLNNRFHTCLRVPTASEARAMRRAKAENRLAALATCDWNEHTVEEWIIHALEFFHCVSGFSRAQARKTDRVRAHSGILLTIKGEEYFIPIPARYLSNTYLI